MIFLNTHQLELYTDFFSIYWKDLSTICSYLCLCIKEINTPQMDGLAHPKVSFPSLFHSTKRCAFYYNKMEKPSVKRLPVRADNRKMVLSEPKELLSQFQKMQPKRFRRASTE